MLFVIALAIIAYVLGSCPWGLIIAKVFCGIDPRTAGSRNTGSTNVARLCGFGWGVATLACDIAKGMVPVLLALWDGGSAVQVSFVALAAVLGHVFSCFMGFRGGKAVATSIGVFIPLAFVPTLISSILCLVVIGVSGFVSLGSLTLLASLPIVLVLCGSPEWLPLALCLLVLVAWRHKENIARLRAGQEKSWRKSKQKSD
ncbi:MAG: glycerol-3-phosphate 1-O-acyltransferase PlsY [Desulfovibrionaceae bacterium]|nr:glycerol-3-phosphate 1-O-acyltransferase PlsY [Desulfovibrionaceae bacterium]